LFRFDNEPWKSRITQGLHPGYKPGMPPSVHNLDIPRLRAQHLMMWRIRALEQAALRGLA
jgi:hypothetical protein